MRVQATAVNQGRGAASRYCRFCVQFFYLSRPLEQKAAAVKGGLIRVKTRPAEEWRQSVLSLSTDMYEILLQAVHPDFQVIPSKGKKEGDFS